jgi:hypothetical protein
MAGPKKATTRKAKKTTPKSKKTFEVPDGYVLIEEKAYRLMQDQLNSLVNTSGSTTQKQSKVTAVSDEANAISLRVLRTVGLGNIRVNLNSNEVIDWVPNRKLIVRGKVHQNLDSFLILWNKQDPNLSTYQSDFDPFFEVLNPEAYEVHFGNPYVGPMGSEVPVINETEEERIAREEVERTPSAIETLPPRGQRQQAIIDRGGVDNAASEARAAGVVDGHNPYAAPESLDSFKVSGSTKNVNGVGTGKKVAEIPSEFSVQNQSVDINK